MNLVVQRNIGAIIELARAGAASSLTAGGAGNNVAVTGATIDRQNVSGAGSAGQPYGGSMPLSALFGMAFTASLAAGKALTGALTVNHSPDGSTWTPLQTIAATQAALSAAGGTVNGQLNFQISLTSAQRYLQFVWTPNLTAASVDTASIFPMLAFGGFDHLPSPN
jgi:hypothetical protein